MLKGKKLGTWFLAAASILALAGLAIYLIWAPGHNAFNQTTAVCLGTGAALAALLFFRDNCYLDVAVTALLSYALLTLLSDSVGSFVDMFQGIVMFGDASQVGTILTISALIFGGILLTIVSCFMPKGK